MTDLVSWSNVGGLALLASLGWQLGKAALTRMRRKDATDASIDDRAVKQIEQAQKALEDERTDHAKTRAELVKANERFVDAMVHGLDEQKHAISAVHNEYRESIQRLHSRIDESVQAHRACEERVLKCESRHAARDEADAKRDRLLAALAEKAGVVA